MSKFKQIIYSTFDDRTLFIERNEKFEVVGLNYFQGELDSIAVKRMGFMDSDPKLLAAYKKTIGDIKFEGLQELQIINEVLWEELHKEDLDLPGL